jgi:hypothetical protein
MGTIEVTSRVGTQFALLELHRAPWCLQGLCDGRTFAIRRFCATIMFG